MGWKYDLKAWLQTGSLWFNGEEKIFYDYVTYYQGDSLWSLIKAWRLARRDGSGCIRLEVR